MRLLTRWRHSVRHPLGAVLVALMLVGAGSVGSSLYGSIAQEHDAHVANVLGRQRMLSQRFLRRAQAAPGAADPALLAADVAAFEQSLRALTLGGEVSIAGERIPVPPARAAEFGGALDRVRVAWKRLLEAVGQVPTGTVTDGPGAVPDETIDAASETLLAELDRAASVQASIVGRRVEMLRNTQIGFLLLGGSLLLVGSILIRFEVVTPALTLRAMVDRVRRGNVGDPPRIAPKNELADLGAAFHHVAARNAARLRERDSLLALSTALLGADTVEAVAVAVFDALSAHCAPRVQSFLVPVSGGGEMELLATAGDAPDGGNGRRIPVKPNGALDQSVRTGEVVFETIDSGVRAFIPIGMPGEPPGAVLVLDLAVRNGTDAAYLRLAAHLAATALLRVRHQEARGEAEARMRDWFEGAPIALYRCAPDGRIVEANPAFATLLGWENAADVVGRPVTSIMETEAEWERLRSEADMAGVVSAWEGRFRCATGRTIRVRGSTRAVTDGRGRRHYECSAEDVTDQRLAEEALRDSEARFLAIVSLAVNERQQIVLFNDAAEKTFGYEASEVLGAPLDLLLPPDTRAAHRDYVAAFGASPDRARRMAERGQVRARRRDGTEFPAETSISKLEVGGERLYTAVLRDVTERQDLEKRLRESQRAAALGTLAAGTAHFFNNLLTVVRGHATLLLDTLTPDDPSREDLESIDGAVSRAASVTRQLLAFTRQQVLTPEPVDTNGLIRDAVPLLHDLLGHEIAVDLALGAEVGDAFVDPDSIGQVLLELAVNGRDAMPGGGTFRIETGRVRLNDAEAATRDVDPGEYVRILLTDTGAGMTSEVASRAFEPFFTTKERATTPGLGLSTVYGIVRQSGGAITMRSAPGKGTTFDLVLPVASRLAEKRPRRPDFRHLPPPAGAAPVVFVVEDEPHLRTLLRRVLERNGYRVLHAGNGLEAVEIAARETGPIDLLVTDIVMPGMNGPAVYERLLATRPDLPVIFTSGYSEEEVSESGGVPEGAAFVPKPFAMADLVGLVSAILARGLAAERERSNE